jgi:hypothetical protein
MGRTMRVTLTEQQREDLHRALTSHHHDLQTERINAHGVDQKRFEFYVKRVDAIEALIPLFAVPIPATPSGGEGFRYECATQIEVKTIVTARNWHQAFHIADNLHFDEWDQNEWSELDVSREDGSDGSDEDDEDEDDGDDEEEEDEDLDICSVDGCGNSTADGEGYDGKCGTCADRGSKD